jgi:4-alpha-glucanotransferase
MTKAPPGRRAGILVPLFSMPSSASWGIGEITDIQPMARWLETAGVSILQLLPINEMDPGESSPYSAISAMAIDPQFIAIERLADFDQERGIDGLDASDREALARARASGRIEYRLVRPIKARALRMAFGRFVEHEWLRATPRAAALRAFVAEESWWLDDYAVFRALYERHGRRPWTEWPEALRARDAAAIEAARSELGDEVLFYQYVQWIAGMQWQHARRAAGRVALFGDFPFMVAANSADVWAHQSLFRLDASIGVPPDAFSETGQNWGLPVYRWDVLQARDFGWLRDRARRSAALYDGYRIDHLVGFYRTYAIPHDGAAPYFTPADEAGQLAQGERLMALFDQSGPEIIAEDLGTVPDFVRASLARLGLPGFRILRWERHWHDPAQPFRDPRTYPAASVAASGTHDTEPMAVWFERAPAEERALLARAPTIADLARGRADLALDAYTDAVRDVLLESLYASGSNVLILPVQDVFGWRDRINEPATVGEDNWTYRLRWPVDRLGQTTDARERAATLNGWAGKYGR